MSDDHSPYRDDPAPRDPNTSLPSLDPSVSRDSNAGAPTRGGSPGDAGFNAQLVGGPLNGRWGRLRDRAFRLWYLTGPDDAPLVWTGAGTPPLEAGQRIVGSYEFSEADEAMRWTPNREGSPMADVPRWMLGAASLGVLALGLAALLAAVRPHTGRWQWISEGSSAAIFDTETGRLCTFQSLGTEPRCQPAPQPTR